MPDINEEDYLDDPENAGKEVPWEKRNHYIVSFILAALLFVIFLMVVSVTGHYQDSNLDLREIMAIFVFPLMLLINFIIKFIKNQIAKNNPNV